jgi:hypothetical protein
MRPEKYQALALSVKTVISRYIRAVLLMAPLACFTNPHHEGTGGRAQSNIQRLLRTARATDCEDKVVLKSSTTRMWKVFGALVAIVAVVIPAASALASPPPATMSAAFRALCHSAGPVAVTAIPAKVDLATCPLQGKKLFLPLRSGRPVVGLYVPRPGNTETAIMLTTKGSYMLSVTNSNGRLVIHTSMPGTASSARIPATDAACGQSNYALLPGAPRWRTTLYWHYNQSTASRAGLDGSVTQSDISAGNYNMTMGINNCGFSQNGFGAHGHYSGTTSKYANIDPGGNCTNNFPDGQNTVSWGPLNNTGVAFDCSIAHTDGTMYESDIYLGSNQAIVDNIPANCIDYGNRDLQTVATHEWGHAYGLNDVYSSSSSALVMYSPQLPCYQRRHLGKGDYDGMAYLYGFR